MPRIFPIVSVCVTALLLGACQNTPTHKMSNGEFDEWKTYEGKHFRPSDGTITAIDTAANTVTIVWGKHKKVFPVTSETQIIHEGTDIPLAQLPLNQRIKFTVSKDGGQLRTIWYGEHLFIYRPSIQARSQNTPL